MDYTDRKKRQVAEEFSRRRQHVFLSGVPLIAWFATELLADGGLIARPVESDGAWVLCGIVCVAVLLLTTRLLWRCPACDRKLRTFVVHMFPRACPVCGATLVSPKGRSTIGP